MTTKDILAEREMIKKWREAAVKDGWDLQPTYKSESVETASTLKKDGFHVSIYLRENIKDYAIHAWGPDRLVVNIPKQYSFEDMEKAVSICTKCGKDGKMVRLGFAGRVCSECRTKLAPKVEFPGWCD